MIASKPHIMPVMGEAYVERRRAGLSVFLNEDCSGPWSVAVDGLPGIFLC